MKKLLAIAVVPVIALAGCQSGSQIAAYTQQICGFVPTAAAISSVLHVSPKASTYLQVAQSICDIVAPTAAAKTFGAANHPVGETFSVYVRGVKVTGHFVR